MSTQRIVFWTVLVLAIAAGAFFWARSAYAPAAARSEKQAAESFIYEVADTEVKRAQGLSGRESIPPNYGMLFIFDEPASPGFWMKDMLVSIDIIWLDSEGIILGIEEHVSPATYPEAFYPPQPVSYVLETRPGEYVAQGWNVGERVPIPE